MPFILKGQHMRIFLIAVSFVNSLLYILVYSYYNNIMDILGITFSAGAQSFFKILLLVIAGFCIGLIPMLLLSPGMKRSRFDIKNFALIGIVPLIFLLLSPGQVTDFIASAVSGNNEKIREAVFYLLSRQAIWSVWTGFALGTSVKICFRKKTYRHSVDIIPDREEADVSRDDSMP
jgi:hypothetical protein